MILRTLLPRGRPALQQLQPRVLRASGGIRTITAAPAAGQGPLLERRSDRELPDPSKSRTNSWIYSGIFLLAVGAGCAAIFNYQKSSSSVVGSTLYALRVHRDAREALGDEIMFKQKFPWIRGTLNQLHGLIDISYDVKGTKGEGTMRFKSTRPGRKALFETELWDLTLNDGRRLNLLEGQESDPFSQPEA